MTSTLPAFDELKQLAATAPDELEMLRQRLVEEIICCAPEECQRRLRGLQFQIDMERRLAKNPLDACIRLSRMMHESFEQMRSTLGDLIELNTSAANSMLSLSPVETLCPSPESAKILPFRRRC